MAWVFPGFGVGGAQVRFAALANRFGRACRHSVVALNGDTTCRAKLCPGLEVDFPEAAHPHGRMVAAVRHAAEYLRALRPDVAVTSNWGAIEWAAGARLAGLRHVHTEDGFGPEEREAQIARRVLTRRLVLRGGTVVLPSRKLLGIATDVWKLPPGRVRYLANGIDLQRFSAAAAMPLPPGEGPVIGTIAALRPEKNLSRLLRAFAVVRAQRPARLLVVGDGPERAGLEALAGALGIAGDTLFAGYSEESERWYASMDAFALPSDTEQMPLSLLEAMASGLPAVCTDVGDVRRMLAPENAPFVVPLTDDAFAHGLSRLLDADGRAVGAANRARAVAAYDQGAMFAAYAGLLGVTLAKGAPMEEVA